MGEMMNVGVLYADHIGYATCFYVPFASSVKYCCYNVYYNCNLKSAYVSRDLGHVYDCLDRPESVNT